MTKEFEKLLISTFSKEGLFVRYNTREFPDLFDKWLQIKSVGYLAEPNLNRKGLMEPGFIFTAKNTDFFGEDPYHIDCFDTSVYRKYPEELVGLLEMPKDGNYYAEASKDFFLECDSDDKSKTMLLVAKEGLFYPLANTDGRLHVLKRTEMGFSDYPLEEEDFWEYFSIYNPIYPSVESDKPESKESAQTKLEFDKDVVVNLDEFDISILSKGLKVLGDSIKQIEKMNLSVNTPGSEFNESCHHLLFDIMTLEALLNKTKVSIHVPADVYKNFTAINGIDFPLKHE